MQVFTFIILKLLVIPFFLENKQFYLEDKTFLEKYIISANHVSRLDAFLIVGSLNFTKFRGLAPFAFMAKNDYLNIWWKRALLYPFGLFPAHKMGKRKVGLEKAQELIDRGFTLCMFPEGQRAMKREVRPKKGVAVLAHKNKLPLLPVNISWSRTKRGRKKATVIFGAPYCLWGNYDFGQYARFMVDNIYALGSSRDHWA